MVFELVNRTLIRDRYSLNQLDGVRELRTRRRLDQLAGIAGA